MDKFYDIKNTRLIPIDFGCILNSADFEFSMTQLTSTETILCSPLFRHIVQVVSEKNIRKSITKLREEFGICLNLCHSAMDTIVEDMPLEWNISTETVRFKLNQLFETNWTEAVWSNFEECLYDNIKNDE